ncbi:MAG: hypothetical protein HXS46_17595 [Theionarchaea archaeon]|nr:MAG: hypothetical protein AYK18_06480 [Theionarchaea archaeon DG-70]MBU7012498.1 hypothetical protein [Theionarchaea archaeon]
MKKDKLEENESSKLPKTGRIGRFAQMIKQETHRDIAEKVMQGAEQYKLLSYAKKAAWWKEAVTRLEQYTDAETCRTILEKCGRKCCGPTFRKRAKQFMDESASIEEFIENLNQKGIGGGRLTVQGDTITGGYDTCYCGQVKKTKEPFDTMYCYCSVGWYKQLFESALGHPVDVELRQSIISGADSCEFTIHVGR